MIGKFFRENKIMSYILTVIRVYLGIRWIEHGWSKAFGDGFDASGFINNAIQNPVMSQGEVAYPTYVAFLESFALPNVELFNFLVAWGEVAVGLGLILGCFTSVAAFFAVFMNFAFVMAGSISSSMFEIILGFIVMSGGYNAAKWGLDRWVLPWVRKNVFRMKDDTVTAQA